MDSKMRDFLSRILNEPGFRAQVQKDPVKALTSLGVAVKPSDVPTPASLPSDEEIRALLVLEKHWERIKACYAWFIICGWPKP
jgi:hypothetical protein